MSSSKIGWLFSLLLSFVGFSLSAFAQAENAQADLPKLQGKWEHRFAPEIPVPPGAISATREVVGNAETVTYFDREGNVVYAHHVEFELRDAGPVRMFIFGNGRILAGPEAGRAQIGRSAYPYRLDGEAFYEVRGMTSNTPAGTPPHVVLWKRVKGENEK